MFAPIETYLERVFATLENVVAPEIESDYARVQLFAAISLLQSLGKKVEYRQELIGERINLYSEVVSRVFAAVEKSGGEPSAELRDFVREFQARGPGHGVGYLEKLEEKFSRTIDFFYANREKLNPEEVEKLDQEIREALNRVCTGDLNFVATDNIDKAKKARGKGENNGTSR
ncbi:MAG: hypothetical protein PHE84_03305 [bacterium]|nr:hypothetical protein [bacterium]